MTLCCPHCGREINTKEIVAVESWKDEDTKIVRDVVLVCPGCEKPLAPRVVSPSDSRSLPN